MDLKYEKTQKGSEKGKESIRKSGSSKATEKEKEGFRLASKEKFRPKVKKEIQFSTISKIRRILVLFLCVSLVFFYFFFSKPAFLELKHYRTLSNLNIKVDSCRIQFRIDPTRGDILPGGIGILPELSIEKKKAKIPIQVDKSGNLNIEIDNPEEDIDSCKLEIHFPSKMYSEFPNTHINCLNYCTVVTEQVDDLEKYEFEEKKQFSIEGKHVEVTLGKIKAGNLNFTIQTGDVQIHELKITNSKKVKSLIHIQKEGNIVVQGQKNFALYLEKGFENYCFTSSAYKKLSSSMKNGFAFCEKEEKCEIDWEIDLLTNEGSIYANFFKKGKFFAKKLCGFDNCTKNFTFTASTQMKIKDALIQDEVNDKMTKNFIFNLKDPLGESSLYKKWIISRPGMPRESPRVFSILTSLFYTSPIIINARLQNEICPYSGAFTKDKLLELDDQIHGIFFEKETERLIRLAVPRKFYDERRGEFDRNLHGVMLRSKLSEFYLSREGNQFQRNTNYYQDDFLVHDIIIGISVTTLFLLILIVFLGKYVHRKLLIHTTFSRKILGDTLQAEPEFGFARLMKITFKLPLPHFLYKLGNILRSIFQKHDSVGEFLGWAKKIEKKAQEFRSIMKRETLLSELQEKYEEFCFMYGYKPLNLSSQSKLFEKEGYKMFNEDFLYIKMDPALLSGTTKAPKSSLKEFISTKCLSSKSMIKKKEFDTTYKKYCENNKWVLEKYETGDLKKHKIQIKSVAKSIRLKVETDAVIYELPLFEIKDITEKMKILRNKIVKHGPHHSHPVAEIFMTIFEFILVLLLILPVLAHFVVYDVAAEPFSLKNTQAFFHLNDFTIFRWNLIQKYYTSDSSFHYFIKLIFGLICQGFFFLHVFYSCYLYCTRITTNNMFYHWSKNQENKKNWIVGGINQFMWIFLIISLAFVTVDVVLFIDWCVSFVMPDDIYQYLAWIIFVPFVVFFAIKLKKKNKPKIKEEKEKKIKFEVELKDKKKAKLQ